MFHNKLFKVVITILSVLGGSEAFATVVTTQSLNTAHGTPGPLHKWEPYKEESYFHYLPH